MTLRTAPLLHSYAAGRLLQADMLAKARAEFDASIETVHNFDDFMGALDRKHMCLAPWCASLCPPPYLGARQFLFLHNLVEASSDTLTLTSCYL